MLVLVNGSVGSMFGRTLVYLGKDLGRAGVCQRILWDVASHIYYVLSPGFTLPDFSAGLQRTGQICWRTREDGSSNIGRSPILAH